jgi:hypothetical protein
MDEPEFTRHPTEIFGYPFINKNSAAQATREKQFCPFLDDECKKPRKSQPEVKIGVCTVGYKGNFLKKITPIIICPHRFREPIVYDTIKELYFGNLPDGYQIKWASEVSCGVAGSIDFVATKMKEGEIEDFLCVEFQAAGTTGTPWPAVIDFKQTGGFKQKTYKYGINWANEFVKTMMQQVYKKGMVVEHWGKKIVFVIQDVGLDYIQSATDAQDLHDARDNDTIHFCTFRTVWNQSSSAWQLEFDKRMSTDIEGIRKILGGAHADRFPTISEFEDNINKRLNFPTQLRGV